MSYQLVFIPGMGADYRVFVEQQKYFPDALVVDWLPMIRNETMREYALRLIKAAIPAPDPQTNYILCGFSFGGVLASYAAEYLHARGIILLASFKDSSQFPRSYKILLYPTYRIPGFLFGYFFLTEIIAFLLYWLGKPFLYPWRRSLIRQFLDAGAFHLSQIIQMTVLWSKTPPNPPEEVSNEILDSIRTFLKDATEMQVKQSSPESKRPSWIPENSSVKSQSKPFNLSQHELKPTSEFPDPLSVENTEKLNDRENQKSVKCPVFHIHGRNDLIIPFFSVDPDLSVPGGHLFVCSDPDKINPVILRLCQEFVKE